MKENVASSTVFERGGGLIHNIDERKNPDNLGLCKVGFLKHELKQNGKNGEGGDCLNFQLLYNIVTA